MTATWPRRMVSGADARAHPDPDPDTLAALYVAVTPALLAGPLPEFGSAAWCDLPADDPARQHATVRAALAWWVAVVYGPGVPAAVVDRIVARRMAAASRDIAGANDWTRQSRQPTREELERRRGRPGGPIWTERHGGVA